MKAAACLVSIACLCPALAAADTAAPPDLAPGTVAPGEPNVQRTLIEDDGNRVEELRVRGQTRSIVVTNKGPMGSSYEIHIGDPSRDLSDAAGSRRGATGQRVWRLLTF